MWFITAIEVDSENKRFKSHRVFGYYGQSTSAIWAIKQNLGSMNETIYSYIVLEHIKMGIHPDVLEDRWFQWDGKKWQACDLPPFLMGISNWAVG